ncbi:unnamed protein product [Parascedosporium putredinis]|uniref:Glycosyltransferase family 17 n=1 Tax=Parascedosporium putredinis TaxID=1442378 RepID=A0A9P1GYE4_9PEZI|nr:unnamed protein product [Parascedosporium putredinis]CAI7990677.1 unnamed protein product [Parascedosporium putredinis]
MSLPATVNRNKVLGDFELPPAHPAITQTGPDKSPFENEGFVVQGSVSSGVFDLQEREDYCARYRLKPFDSERIERRKTYDLLLVNTELEMLEIRLGEMYPYVDYFVILEADRSFSGIPKKLYIEENWQLFSKYHDKMIRRTVDFSSVKEGDNAWVLEKLSRNAMVNQVLPFLTGDQAPHEDDILLVSDVDEIPKPPVLQALRNCEVPPRITINSEFYYYSFQWLSREEWMHPQATIWKGNDTVKPEELRHHAGDYHFKRGAWHCSYCFSTMEETVGKVKSFSHQEFNKPEFKDPAKILQRVRFGTDFFDRKTSVYDYVRNNQDRPLNANYLDIPEDGNVDDVSFG